MIAVFSPDRPETKVTSAVTSRPTFLIPTIEPLTADDCKKLQTKAGYKVMLEVKPGMPLGQFHDELVIKTDHPKKLEMKVSISGNATGPISVFPDNVRLPNVTSKKGTSKEITLMVRGGTTTNFEVAYKPKEIQIQIAPNIDNPKMKGRYRATLTVPPGAAPGWINDHIILKTDHPKASELKIPVSIYVSNSGAG
jgi:hypothetical protein